MTVDQALLRIAEALSVLKAADMGGFNLPHNVVCGLAEDLGDAYPIIRAALKGAEDTGRNTPDLRLVP